MTINPFQAIYPRVDYITSAEMFFSTVKEDFNEYAASGFFNKSYNESIYVYQIRRADRTYTGILACTDIEDYQNGKIIKHEHTIAAKEQQQLHLLLRRKAMVKPVLLTYPQVDQIDQLLAETIKERIPFLTINFEEENEQHIFWEITDGDSIKTIQDLFSERVPHAYIADGHHRTSATAVVAERSPDPEKAASYKKLLTAYFPTNELEIFDFNRVIESLGDYSTTQFMAYLSQILDITPVTGPAKPSQKHEMVLFLNHEWYRLNWKKRILKKHPEGAESLDVFLLNHYILNGILGIENVRSDQRVKYVEGKRGMDGFKNRVLKVENRVGFLLFPIDMQEFLDISDRGQVLPPKSTWFEPRMKNGLIVYEY